MDYTQDINLTITIASQPELTITGIGGAKGDTGATGATGAPGTTDFNALLNKPTLGTAAATDSTDYATAAQGAKADTATQPADLTTGLNTKANTIHTHSIADVSDLQTQLAGKQASGDYATNTALTSGLATKEDTIAAGTTSQYYRGDKTFQTLDKTAVGLGNVDNTSDADKPVSTAQAAADALKVSKSGDTMTGNLTVNAEFQSGKTTITSSQVIPLSVISNATSGGGAGSGIVALSSDGAALAINDRLGFFLFGGNYDATNSYNSTGMTSFSTETWSPTGRGANLSFEVTANGTTSRLTALRLNHDGLTLTRSVSPFSNLSFSLGAGGQYYSNLYAQRLNLNSTVYIDGATAGVAALTGSLTTTGNADVHQLIVKGHTTQTNNLLRLVNSSNTLVASISNDGTIRSGRLEPLANVTHESGSSFNYWLTTYSRGLYFNATAFMQGTTAGQIQVTGLLMPVQAPTASAPAYVKGAMYFDTTLNKLRVGGATAWETVTSS